MKEDKNGPLNNTVKQCLGLIMLIYRELFLCLFLYPFKQLCLTVEAGVGLTQLVCISCTHCLYSAGLDIKHSFNLFALGKDRKWDNQWNWKKFIKNNQNKDIYIVFLAVSQKKGE